MKKWKKGLSLFVLFLLLVPSLALAAESRTIIVNGKTVTVATDSISHYTAASKYNNKCLNTAVGNSGHVCCAGYAEAMYKKIWGVAYSKTGNNMLSYLSADQRYLNVDNIRYFCMNAAPGAIVRIDAAKTLYRSDNGHELILISANDSGGVFWEGNYGGERTGSFLVSDMGAVRQTFY